MRSLRTYMITSRIVIGHTSSETITHYIGSPGSMGICVPSMIIMCLRTMLTVAAVVEPVGLEFVHEELLELWLPSYWLVAFRCNAAV